MNSPPSRPAKGCSARDATVTTPPPSGYRQATSAYLSERRTKTISVIPTKIAERAP